MLGSDAGHDADVTQLSIKLFFYNCTLISTMF